MKKIALLITLIIILLSTACGGRDLRASYDQDSPEDSQKVEEVQEDLEVENPETSCSAINPHPMAESISETFEISYDEVMTLYCDGNAFSDILLALETAQLVDYSVEELLTLLDEQTWEDIWQDLGVSLP
jgi:hypothetical protein